MFDIPLWVFVVATALAVGVGPLILKQLPNLFSKKIGDPTPPPPPEVRQSITRVFNAEDADDLALAHTIELYKAGKYDLAKQAFDLAIAQKQGEPA